MVSVPGECAQKCAICGETGETKHKMVSVPGECAQKCAVCGETGRIVHKYKKDPDTGSHICVVCGTNKEDEAGFLYKITAMVLRDRRLKRQQDIDILNADVSKIGEDEAARRAKKYQC
jgi:hypothetical protein